MILWYYQIWPKVVWKVVHDYQNKQNNITITKHKSPLFFRVVYHSQNHVIPHPDIAAIL